jgi:primosomal protein N' (replication factor Y)
MALLRAEAKHADAPMQFLHAAGKAFAPFEKGGHEGFVLAATDSAQARIPVDPRSSKAEALAIGLHGPLPAPMPKRAGMHRAQLVLSAPTRRLLHAALDAIVPALHALPEARKVRWSLDVDPVDLY